MKHIFRLLLILLVLLTPLLMAAQATEDPGIKILMAQLAGLGGAGALVALLVNTGKSLGWVKNDDAPKWFTGANIIILIGLYLLGIFKPEQDIAGLDKNLGVIAQIGGLLLAFLIEQFGSRAGHAAVKGFPIIGTSYTLRRAKQYGTPVPFSPPTGPPTYTPGNPYPPAVGITPVPPANDSVVYTKNEKGETVKNLPPRGPSGYGSD